MKYKLTNTLFYRNESERDWGNYAMNRSADEDGGGNLQFPAIRFNQSGTPGDNKVTPGVLIADPLLGALSDNGGSGETRPLGAGSAAIDAGVAGCPVTDQRGLPRDACDIGAYEWQGGDGFSAVPVASGSPDAASLSLQVNLPPSLTGQNGHLYLAALLGEHWYLHDGQTWQAWTGGSLPVRLSGAFPARLELPVYQQLDIRSLSGAQLLIGYGRNEAELLANGQYRVVYTLP